MGLLSRTEHGRRKNENFQSLIIILQVHSPVVSNAHNLSVVETKGPMPNDGKQFICLMKSFKTFENVEYRWRYI
jgi:hypothetical protein